MGTTTLGLALALKLWAPPRFTEGIEWSTTPEAPRGIIIPGWLEATPSPRVGSDPVPDLVPDPVPPDPPPLPDPLPDPDPVPVPDPVPDLVPPDLDLDPDPVPDPVPVRVSVPPISGTSDEVAVWWWC